MTKLSSLKGQKIKGIKEDANKPQYLCFYSETGMYLFSVDRDQIYDRAGNRFELDFQK